MTLTHKRNFGNEFSFSASRSSGSGGQNVNKLNTKVELRFNISTSTHLSDDEKRKIFTKLSSRINDAGELILVSQSERSQLKNKEDVIEKFYQLIAKALKPTKKRRPTKPTKASKERRLESKRHRSKTKSNRGPIVG